ncbi:MAG TPA: exodeoxyribonuclease VII large subunit [Gemmatimonadaceae bacterium]|nr:exodeoxyribonuclease VII large subunit [Gemmatimonadaceae bacterium]
MTERRRDRGAPHGAGDSPDLFAATPPRARKPSADPGEAPDTALTVSTLAGYLAAIVEGSTAPLWVRGEVTGFKAHRNGHWYFALRDAHAQLRCVVWARDTQRVPAPPDEGMQITAFGRFSVYAARTDVRFAITRLDAAGDGLWRKAFERARANLEKDGLLDPAGKRPLPSYPRVIAVVTSPDGAALHDIVSVATRRDPKIRIVVIPAAVQGESAPAQIVAALRRLSRWGGADVAIVARGGGSREELWAFNDERVARAVAASDVPTISAIGHEVDVSLCDLVADVRAATPSAAAEAAVPVRADIEAGLSRTARRLRSALTYRAERARSDLTRNARELSLRARRVVELRRAWLTAVGSTIDALSPMKTLQRGYAVARSDDGSTLSSVGEFIAGREFTLTVRDGDVRARSVERKDDAS